MSINSISNFISDLGAYGTSNNRKPDQPSYAELDSNKQNRQEEPQVQTSGDRLPDQPKKVSVPARLRSEINPTQANEILEQVAAQMGMTQPYALVEMQMVLDRGILPANNYV